MRQPANTITQHSGFTLIELLVVIVIIALLATGSILGFGSIQETARINKAKEEIRKIQTAMELLAIDTGQWPGHQAPFRVCAPGPCSSNEITDLNAPSAGLVATDGSYPNWDGPYIQEVEVDPWGFDYFFDSDYDINYPSGDYVAAVGSLGPDGDGLADYDADNVIRIVAGS